MKKYTILIIGFLVYITPIHSQELIQGVLWVTVNEESARPVTNTNRTSDLSINSAFEEYGVIEYQAAFPNAKSELLKNTYELMFSGNTENFYSLLATDYNSHFSDVKLHYQYDTISVYDPVDWMWVDPNNNWLWHLEKIQADLAWDITRGDPNVTIAIIDTDIDPDHPDLATELKLPYEPYTGVVFDCDPSKRHGIHVASLVTAETTEQGDTPNGQLASVGFNTKFIFYHAHGIGFLKYLQKAHHASLVMNVDVLTSSAGGWRCGGSPDPIEEAAVKEILDNGTVIVMPAGNGFNGTHCDNGNDGILDPWFPLHPIYDDRIIIVSSTDIDDNHGHIVDGVDYTHSHFESVDICAPGWGVMVAKSTECGEIEWPYYGSAAGTSFATPIVAGAVSLIKSLNKDFTPGEIQYFIKETADPIADADNYPGQLGAGRLNIFKAVEMANNCEPLVVNSDETWDAEVENICGIVVKAGATLTINGEVKLSKNSKVVVEKGAKLIVDGGKLTKLYNNLWQGIFVQGDKTLRQAPSSNMGQLIVKNGGTIEYAGTAVHNFALNEDGSTDWNSTGGIIKTYAGAQFLNNKRDVEFLSYQNYAGSSPINDKSYFQETTFAVTELLPNGQTPLDRITMYQVDGIKIKACDFSSSTEYVMGLRGDGIYAIDASFVVESYQDNPSTFTNLAKGIEAKNYNDYYTVSVNKAQFNDLPAGIFMLDVMEASITENQFSVYTSSTFKSPYGLYMVGCSGYKVEENVFTGEPIAGSTPLGIVINNKELEADNNLYRNEFFDLNTGILVMGTNGNGSIFEPTGLEVLCNRFSNSLSSYTDFALTNKGSVSFMQGRQDGLTTGPAGNIFSAMACNKENSLFVSDDSFYYTYNHHSNPETTPGQGCYTPDHVLLNNTTLEYNVWENEACPSKLGSDDEIELPGKKLAVEESKSELVVLKAEYETVVDGGESGDLLTLVQDPLESSYTIRTELKASSPYLSDEVLDAVIMRNPALNAWHLAEIMMANAPVSPMVWETFEQNTTMPNFLFNYVYYYQQNGGTSSRAELEMQMKTQVDIKEKASSDYVRGQMLLEDNENKNQKILELYAVDNDNLAIRRKVAALSSSGDFAGARELLSAYNDNPELDVYATVQDIVIDINESGNNPTAVEISALYDIAYGEKFGKYKAQAILAYVDGAEFDHPIVLPDPNQKSGAAGKKGRRPVEIVPILASYPNPGDKLMHFTFQLPAELNSAIIEVYNVDGPLVEQIDVSSGIGIYEYDTAGLKAGTYISSLLVNGDKVATHKFQVQH